MSSAYGTRQSPKYTRESLCRVPPRHNPLDKNFDCKERFAKCLLLSNQQSLCRVRKEPSIKRGALHCGQTVTKALSSAKEGALDKASYLLSARGGALGKTTIFVECQRGGLNKDTLLPSALVITLGNCVYMLLEITFCQVFLP